MGKRLSMAQEINGAIKLSGQLGQSCCEALNETWNCAMPAGEDGFEAMRSDAILIKRVLQKTKRLEEHMREVVTKWPAFDIDDNVAGADLVEWFAGYRAATRKLLGGTASAERKAPIKILVTVQGGCVDLVACSPVPTQGIEAAVVDFDGLPDDGDESPDLNRWFFDGQTARKFLDQVRMDNPHYKSLF